MNIYGPAKLVVPQQVGEEGWVFLIRLDDDETPPPGYGFLDVAIQGKGKYRFLSKDGKLIFLKKPKEAEKVWRKLLLLEVSPPPVW